MRKIRILFLAANPYTTSLAQLEAEVAAIRKALPSSEYQGRVEFALGWAMSIDDLREELDYYYPHVVHFIGRSPDEGITLVDSSGQSKLIDAQTLYFVFAGTLKKRARLVVLHACYLPEQVITKQSIPLAELAGCVIGINHCIDAGGALRFVTCLYKYIIRGSSTLDAFNQGKSTLSSSVHLEVGSLELLVRRLYPLGEDVLLPLREVSNPSPPSPNTIEQPVKTEEGEVAAIQSTRPSIKPVDLLVVYAQEDQELQGQLINHLNLLKNQGLIRKRYECNISHKEGQTQAIEQLSTAKVILLLVSVHFMNLDFIASSDMKKAIIRHEQGEAYVIPILLRTTYLEGALFSQLPRLPGDNRAITSRMDHDAVYLEIVERIRLVLEEQGRETLQPIDKVEPAPTQSVTSYPLTDVFVISSIPKVTFVENEEFGRLKLAISQKGRSVVIEGPSGIGKTTAIQKAIDEIQFKHLMSASVKAEIRLLSARNPSHLKDLGTLEQWHKEGTVIIDEFHHLSVELSRKIVDYLKLLADTESETKKLVIVGIPQSGQKLVDLSFDAANRIGVFQWGKEKDELVLQMIEKGEKALNIQLKHKMEIAIMARGSLNVAQFLCLYICQQERITATQPQLRMLESNINSAVSNVIAELALKFADVTTLFAGLGGPRDSTCLCLLEELAASRNGSLSLMQLKEIRRELSAGIERFINKKWIDILYKKHPYSKNCFYFDPSTSILMIEDPQLTFYLRQSIPYSKLARDAGIEVAIRQHKVFVCYCKADLWLLKRVQIHLQPLANDGIIDLWDDTKLVAGVVWEKELQTAIETAKVAIVLVSADLLASDFVEKYQLSRLFLQAEEGGTRIIPLVVAPCLFKESRLGIFQEFNPSEKSMRELGVTEREKLLTRLAQSIKKDLRKDEPQK